MAIKLEGTRKFSKTIKRLKLKVRKTVNSRVSVGFSQRYALFVHEDLTAKHPRGGQAKFLETPSRQLGPQLSNIIRQVVQSGNTLLEGQLAAGEVLLNAATDLTPIDTGALRLSGFVSDSKNEQAAAQAAFQRSESHRTATLSNRKLSQGNVATAIFSPRKPS
jgi:hypothetical protein